ncbi:hypothetical protein AWZ03_008506 [Drosophila navojoa]|uniref:Uncharacterized protein n=1 Tax=Drosophila navojoa TaxID=7232 RepID=A0A484BB93_DRONA|nr:hypothetical protein AWZ03_008506 [Drosophila navojoa]
MPTTTTTTAAVATATVATTTTATTTAINAHSMPTTTTTTTIATTSAGESVFTLPPDVETVDETKPMDAHVAAADNGDEILRNIIESNKRLANELAKMPPLPKFTSYNAHSRMHNSNRSSKAETTTTAAATTTMGAKPKCFCPSFMRHKHEHEHVYTKSTMRRRNSNDISATCCSNSNSNSSSNANNNSRNRGATARTQTTHSKSMHCHAHEFTLDTHHQPHQPQQQYCTAPATSATSATSTPAAAQQSASCCHPCKTELLPWLQQHLVLNQTISSANSCQAPCQSSHLTVDTETTATATATATPAATTKTSAVCKGRNSNALNASIKPKLYFEQLLQRDGCHKKPRPPVKVDVNVRLVPKQAKQSKQSQPKVNTLNETFVQELDEVAQALNETFVKESSPELAKIDEQLAQFEDVIDDDVEDDDQEQATKL